MSSLSSLLNASDLTDVPNVADVSNELDVSDASNVSDFLYLLDVSNMSDEYNMTQASLRGWASSAIPDCLVSGESVLGGFKYLCCTLKCQALK